MLHIGNVCSIHVRVCRFSSSEDRRWICFIIYPFLLSTNILFSFIRLLCTWPETREYVSMPLHTIACEGACTRSLSGSAVNQVNWLGLREYCFWFFQSRDRWVWVCVCIYCVCIYCVCICNSVALPFSNFERRVRRGNGRQPTNPIQRIN